jgi:hypothetical protein
MQDILYWTNKEAKSSEEIQPKDVVLYGFVELDVY